MVIAGCILHPDECAMSNAVTVWIKCKSHQCGPDNVHYRGNCMTGSVLSYMSLCLCVVRAQTTVVPEHATAQAQGQIQKSYWSK